MKQTAYFICLGVFAVGALLVNAVSLGVCLTGRADRHRALVYGLIARLMRFFDWLIRRTGVGEIALPERFAAAEPGQPGTLFVANHTGLLDALFLLTRIPEGQFIFKAGLVRNPLFSHTPRALGFVINRAHLAGLVELTESLRAGRHVLIFPEGTRTETPPVNRFHAGFAHLALQSGAPIQPIVIRNPAGVCGKNRPLSAMPPLPFGYRFGPGTPVLPQPGESRGELTRRIETYYHEALAGEPVILPKRRAESSVAHA
ncbi:MAG: lysophospholipid acyltransferase family protein [Verrucomicrobiota bacterium]